ncbi:hypothetical protein PACG_02817 [Pseudomonas aeruginosa C3719]|nr:hypothetical protein PACG_02817 [Pseudomonas aeruginosa C3719]
MSGKPRCAPGRSDRVSRCRATAATRSSAARPTSSSTICPLPAQGDATACGATLSANVIANVLINGKPATVVGSVGTHGNLVVGGAGTVLIGNSGGGAPALALAPPKLCLQCLLLAARRNQALVPLESLGGAP